MRIHVTDDRRSTSSKARLLNVFFTKTLKPPTIIAKKKKIQIASSQSFP